ncbi:MAG TPA: hypothetical protein VGT03_14090 [Candidatus Acidoferrales bacterium]|nr:hypothetical protein [Candidatus Acidoferrales bacterium]
MIRVLREVHEASRELQHRIVRAGGVNRFGEPNFRVVWGWSRLTWIGGKWADTDSSGNLLREVVELREVPKYFPHDRWHIERWMPPEAFGSPAQWYSQTMEREDGILIPALGPYPRRGEYEHCFTLQGLRGEFIPLSPAICEWIVRAIEFARARPSVEHLAAIERRAVARERAWHARADDILDAAMPTFHGLPFIAAG